MNLAQPPARVGVVLHPTRDVGVPLEAVRRWAHARDVKVAQIPFEDAKLQLDGTCRPAESDLVVAIGGDGTTLAAIHSAAPAGRPVLGVACGSLGVLTAVPGTSADAALERYARGDWAARPIPALSVHPDGGEPQLAFNDVVVIRHGEGQLRVALSVDGERYVRVAGDGCVVSTPAGSSAYTIAAGGPLLSPRLEAYVVTVLPTHGGFHPPLTLEAAAQLELQITAGHGGGRWEVDGRVAGDVPRSLRFSFVAAAATLVGFPGQEQYLAGLRRRGILTDSPRILADDRRA